MEFVEEKRRRRPCISQLSKRCQKYVFGLRCDRICFACATLIREREESLGNTRDYSREDLGIFEKVRSR